MTADALVAEGIDHIICNGDQIGKSYSFRMTWWVRDTKQIFVIYNKH